MMGCIFFSQVFVSKDVLLPSAGRFKPNRSFAGKLNSLSAVMYWYRYQAWRGLDGILCKEKNKEKSANLYKRVLSSYVYLVSMKRLCFVCCAMWQKGRTAVDANVWGTNVPCTRYILCTSAFSKMPCFRTWAFPGPCTSQSRRVCAFCAKSQNTKWGIRDTCVQHTGPLSPGFRCMSDP